MAERYLYIPSVGFALAAGALFSAVMIKKGVVTVSQDLQTGMTDMIKPVFIPFAICIMVSAVFAVMTFQRNYVWRDDYSIGKAMIKDAPYFAVGYSHLGSVYKKQGRFDEAIDYFKQAIKLNPKLPESYNNLGLVYIEQGRLDDAVIEFQKALNIKPNDPELRINLAGAYIGLQRFADAERELREILRLRPDEPDANYNLGTLYLQQSRLDEAIEQLSQAVRLRPADQEARHLLRHARALKEKKK
jgi:tetratricopeptide (TPR) repeat protein